MKQPIQLSEQGNIDIEQLNASLGRYCLSLTNCDWESDDLKQATWIKFLESINLQQHNNIEALLLRTAKNTWIDHVRRKKVFGRILNRYQEQCSEQTDLSCSRFNLEIAFQLLIKHLTPLQRTVTLMRGVLGYSSAETAKKLNTTEGAVKTAYHRARKNLKGLQNEINLEQFIIEDSDAAGLKKLAEAYLNGEVEAVLRLIQMDHPAQVTAIEEYGKSLQPQMGHLPSMFSNYSFQARMSA